MVTLNPKLREGALQNLDFRVYGFGLVRALNIPVLSHPSHTPLPLVLNSPPLN